MQNQGTSVFAPYLALFLERMQAAQALQYLPDPDTPVVEVDEAVRSLAGFYERTRNTLEYGEGDFLRQRALVRLLHRLANSRSSFGSEEQALELLRELIRAGYFPNESIPENVGIPIAQALDRFAVALSTVPSLFHDEIFRFAAFEIEDAIFPERAAAQRATVAMVIEAAETRFRWPKEASVHPAHRAFLFIAAHRAVLNADRYRILYAFMRDAFPGWFQAPAGEMAALSEEFERILERAKQTIAHMRSEQYTRAMRRMAAAFRALDDAVSTAVRDGVGETLSIMQLERRLDEAVAERISQVKKKLRVAAWRATLYVFFTKMLVAFALELPYELLILGSFVLEPFLINMIFPPALMFFVAFSARPPRASVAERIVDDAMAIATPGRTLAHMRLPRERSGFRLTAFVLCVALLGGGALFFILKSLGALNFTPMAMAMFLAFFSLVSLFAWRIRRPLRELAVSGGGRGGILGALVEVMVFPFLAVGRAMSEGLRSVNVFVFLLDVFIESPLKLMFAAVEDWLAFLREKREQLVED